MTKPSRSIPRRLFDLSWPIIGLNLLQVLALAVDTAMIGRTPDAEAALVGMGYASQLVFLLMVAMIGLTVGTVALISRAHGAQQDDRVNHVLHQSTQLTVILGVVVAIVGNLLAEPLLLALGSDDVALHTGLLYFRPLLAGTTFTYLNILYAAALRGMEDTRSAFFVSLVMNLLNVVFNYGLILGNFGLPALGIQGAAIGTVAAQACATALMVWWLSRGHIPALKPVFRVERIDLPLAKSLIGVGWPAATDMLVLNAAFLSIIGMLGRIDQAAVAAHGLGLRVQALAFVPGLSVSQAVGAMVGNALGAGHVDEAKRVLRSGILLCTVIMGSLGLLLIALDDLIVSAFGVDAGTPLFAYSKEWMQLLGYAMPPVGVWIALVGLFQGSGATRITLRINAVVTVFAQIPGSAILGFVVGLGAFGVWAAFPLTFLLKLAWGIVAYRKGAWAKTGTSL
ncbi:MAG: MATE family efflux transporter [Myxococcota bacterium]